MSDATSKAVFLSYASQDAEAARRICEALRSGGVEVWFDADGGLEHGDEWDAKIRRQIKECVLFIPIISANTQARHEGYFRIEWDLAAERARGIASGVPFILPVVIDDTREPDALVPDRFRAVQWTRLRGGEVPPEMQQRFLKLWSHRTGVLAHQAEPKATAPADSPVPAPRSTRQGSPRGWIAVAAATAVLLGALGWKFLHHDAAVAPAAEAPRAGAPPATEKSAAPLSEARQLVVKARALFEAVDSIRDDFLLAEDLLKQALAKDSGDAEVWACYSQLHNRFVVRGWEVTNARKEGAQVAAQRALRLDPQSFEARFAQACLAGDTPGGLADGERAWRELRRERPTDQRVLVSLGVVLRKLNRQDEADALYDESAALPGGDPLALYDKSLDAWFLGRTAEAEAAMRASIAQKPFSGALLMTAWYAMILHGDLDGALAAMNRVSPATLREDRGCYFAYYLHYLRRETDAALDRLRELPRDWLDDNWYRGPKGKLAGEMLQRAGRTAAAAVEWRAALKQVEARLANDSTNRSLLYNRIYLLANLGERDEAARQFPVWLQMGGIDLADDKPVPPSVTRLCVLLGRHAEAIQQIRRGLREERHAVAYTAATLRLDGDWDPLRGEPEFANVIAEAEAMEKAAALPAGATTAAPTADPKSIAVLPFENLSEDKANAFFADGMHEDILTNLSNVRELHVTSRTSVMQYRATTKSLRQIGAELGVAYVLEGSVQRAGSKVRVTGQLIDARTDEHVWAKSYDRDLTDLFAIQSELAQAIAAALSAALSPQEKSLLDHRPTTNLAAYDLFLKARANYFGSSNDISPAQVEQLLLEAVKLDPAFAQAWAYLAWRDARAYFDEEDHSPERLANARAAIENAVRLAPGDPEVIEMQGNYYYYGYRDYARAAEQYQRLLLVRPNSAKAHAQLGYLERRQGRWPEALASLRTAARLDPRNLGHARSIADTLQAMRRYDEATAAWRHATELAAGDLSIAYSVPEMAFYAHGTTRQMEEWLAGQKPAAADETKLLVVRRAWARFHGDWAQAVQLDREHPYLDPWDDPHWAQDAAAIGDLVGANELAAARTQAKKIIPELTALNEKQPANSRLWTALAFLHAFEGDRESALRCARQPLELVPETADALVGPANSMTYAQILAWTGDRDGALAELARLLRKPAAGDNSLNVYSARFDPGWLPLHGDPRFEALLADPQNNAPLF